LEVTLKTDISFSSCTCTPFWENCSEPFAKYTIDNSTLIPKPTFYATFCILQQHHPVYNIVFIDWSQHWCPKRFLIAENMTLDVVVLCSLCLCQISFALSCSSLSSFFSPDQSQPCVIFYSKCWHWLAILMDVYVSVRIVLEFLDISPVNHQKKIIFNDQNPSKSWNAGVRRVSSNKCHQTWNKQLGEPPE